MKSFSKNDVLEVDHDVLCVSGTWVAFKCKNEAGEFYPLSTANHSMKFFVTDFTG